MQFSDTTTKQGLIQDCEFWTNLGDALISGDSTLLKVFTNLINRRYERTVAHMQLLTPNDGLDDTNYTDHSFATFTITSGTHDYEFLTDEDGNTISDITGVHIKQGSSGTLFVPLTKLDLADADAQLIMSPNSTSTGIPTGYIERNNTVFLTPIPNFTLSAGGKLFYRLVPSYFSSSDTTKSPGFARPYHRILSLGASLDWLIVNKPDNQVAIQVVSNELNILNQQLEAFVRQKNPTTITMTPGYQDNR